MREKYMTHLPRVTGVKRLARPFAEERAKSRATRDVFACANVRASRRRATDLDLRYGRYPFATRLILGLLLDRILCTNVRGRYGLSDVRVDRGILSMKKRPERPRESRILKSQESQSHLVGNIDDDFFFLTRESLVTSRRVSRVRFSRAAVRTLLARLTVLVAVILRPRVLPPPALLAVIPGRFSLLLLRRRRRLMLLVVIALLLRRVAVLLIGVSQLRIVVLRNLVRAVNLNALKYTHRVQVKISFV